MLSDLTRKMDKPGKMSELEIIMNPARALAELSSQARFPATCGGVSEHNWDYIWIEDSSRLAARSFNDKILFPG